MELLEKEQKVSHNAVLQDNWHPEMLSDAEREMYEEAAEKEETRAIKRVEKQKHNIIKGLQLALFSVFVVSAGLGIGYTVTGLVPTVIWASPLLAGILAYLIHAFQLNRFAGAVLFSLPAFFTLPVAFVGLLVLAWGGIVGFICEPGYEEF